METRNYPRKRLSEKTIQAMREMKEKNPEMSQGEIADAFGVCAATVSRHIGYKTTEAKIEEIRLMKEHMPELTKDEIAEALGVPRHVVGIYLKEDRGERKAKQPKKRKFPKCPKCGAEVTNKGARFCWRCGGDVRSEEFKLCERLMAIFGGHYGLSDEHAEAIRDACRYIGYDPDGKGLMA